MGWRQVLEHLVPRHILEPLSAPRQRAADQAIEDVDRVTRLAEAQARQFELEETLARALHPDAKAP